MSLINRTLDQLAARQAPGAEALDGVRLAEPLAQAQSGLSLRRLAVLLALALGAAALAWLLWPKPAPIEPPRVRGLGSAEAVAALAAAGAAPQAQPALPPEAAAPTPPPASAPVAVARAPVAASAAPGWQLQLDTQLDASPPAVAQPRSEARETRRVQGRPERARTATPRTGTAQRESAPPADPAANAPAAVEPDPAAQARAALARGEPQAALDVLGAAPDADAERDALRAAALQRLGRHVEAESAYRTLAARDPAQPAHDVGLAISLEALERQAEARDAYRRALYDARLAPALRTFAQSRLNQTEPPR